MLARHWHSRRRHVLPDHGLIGGGHFQSASSRARTGPGARRITRMTETWAAEPVVRRCTRSLHVDRSVVGTDGARASVHGGHRLTSRQARREEARALRQFPVLLHWSFCFRLLGSCRSSMEYKQVLLSALLCLGHILLQTSGADSGSYCWHFGMSVTLRSKTRPFAIALYCLIMRRTECSPSCGDARHTGFFAKHRLWPSLHAAFTEIEPGA